LGPAGRYHWSKRTEESLRKAIEYFDAAVSGDPTYVPAYSALADSYNQLGTVMVGSEPPSVMRPRAAEAAIRALQIDPDLAEAHATLGYVKHYDWQWAEAERELRRALELNPSYALGHIWYANFLVCRKRLDEAVAEVRKAEELDPLSMVVLTNVGWTLAFTGRLQEAIDHYHKALALDRDYVQAHWRRSSRPPRAGVVGADSPLALRSLSRNTGHSVSHRAERLPDRANGDGIPRRIPEVVDALLVGYRDSPRRQCSPRSSLNFWGR